MDCLPSMIGAYDKLGPDLARRFATTLWVGIKFARRRITPSILRTHAPMQGATVVRSDLSHCR